MDTCKESCLCKHDVLEMEVTRAEVGNFSTQFTLSQTNHPNGLARMSPQALIHHIGFLCGKELADIVGLKFKIVIENTINESGSEKDKLNLCGKLI